MAIRRRLGRPAREWVKRGGIADARWTQLRIRLALTEPPRSWVRVYDATGRLIATVDPVSGRRYPVAASPASPPARRGLSQGS